ncbi:MAG: YggT family protein [Desulfitobacteriaceae bacterium]
MVSIITWAIVIRALLSFIPISPQQPVFQNIIRLLYDVTEPLLKPFRRFQLGGGSFAVDFSPVLAIITLGIIRGVLVSLLTR